MQQKNEGNLGAKKAHLGLDGLGEQGCCGERLNVSLGGKMPRPC